MQLTDEEANVICLILKDHRDCMSEGDVPFNERMTRGDEIIARLQHHGIQPEFSADEYDAKINLIVELDRLIEKLGG